MPSHDTIFHFIFLLPFKEWLNELITFQILQLTPGFRRGWFDFSQKGTEELYHGLHLQT